MRKLRNGSTLEALVLWIRFGAASKVVDTAVTVSHAIRRFESIIEVPALRLAASLKMIQNEPEGKSVAGTSRAGNVTMADDVLQGNVVTVFQAATELN